MTTTITPSVSAAYRGSAFEAAAGTADLIEDGFATATLMLRL
jgi:hypothetical protein